MTHIPGMMEFGISGGGWNTHEIPEPRRFDKVVILTGTPKADTFELDAPGFGTQSLDDDFIRMSIDFENNLIASSNPDTVDVTTDSEEDILVYQEQERTTYLKGFQAPTARSYTYIENLIPIDDQIFVDGGKGHVLIMSDENDIPMLTDDIQPANWLNPCNEDGGDCFFL